MNFEANIRKFNEMYKLPVATHPTTSQLGVPVEQRLRAFKEILLEEINEIDEILLKIYAMQHETEYSSRITGLVECIPTEEEILTDIADLLGDIQVYCASEMAKFGLPQDVVLGIIMDSNFSKMGEDGKPVYDERGKLMKGPNYWKPEPKIKAFLSALIATRT